MSQNLIFKESVPLKKSCQLTTPLKKGSKNRFFNSQLLNCWDSKSRKQTSTPLPAPSPVTRPSQVPLSQSHSVRKTTKFVFVRKMRQRSPKSVISSLLSKSQRHRTGISVPPPAPAMRRAVCPVVHACKMSSSPRLAPDGPTHLHPASAVA